MIHTIVSDDPSETPLREEIVSLYASVGWSAYTSDPDGLMRAIHNSTWVAWARVDSQLVGLVRVLSDDVAIAWIQDILVHPQQQRVGVGRALMDVALRRFAQVRTLALLTDNEHRQHAFYQAIGLTELRAHPPGTLHCFLRMR